MRFPTSPHANPVRQYAPEPGWSLAALAFAAVMIAVVGLSL